MKEKIEQLAKGIYEYELPDILVSDDIIEVSLQEDTVFHGSVTFKAGDNRTVKGVVYSSNQTFHIIQETFVGVDNVIKYEVSGKRLQSGESIEGEVTIVSNIGEKIIPFCIKVESRYFDTSIGKIRDLYQFSDLAKVNWHEALALFKQKEFAKVFLNNEKEDTLYRSLLKGRNSSIELEEFLIAVRKKERVNLSIDKIKEYHFIENTTVMDKILLTKDNWGFIEIRTSTDAPFIELDHKIIWSDNFLGSTFSLEYVIKPELMRNGKNYGRIFIKTIHQTLVVEVCCQCNKSDRIKENDSFKIREIEKEFTLNYLDFRLARTSVEEYQERMKGIVASFQELSHLHHSCNLIRTHLSILLHDLERTKLLLEHFEEQKDEIKQQSVSAYCGYLYLNSLHDKTEEVIQDAVQEIWDIYNSGDKKLDILWYLIYLDKKYETNKKLKLGLLLDQYKLGSRSPILYYEIYNIYKEEPNLMTMLSEAEIQVVYWAVKNQILTEDMREQFTFLAGRLKGFHRLVYVILSRIYQLSPSKEILSVICSLLIKGHKTSNQYFPWFQLGVKEQLRITDLYEYYMYTINEMTDSLNIQGLNQPDLEVFESQVLLYYLYNSNLSDKKKAYLYARVVKNKEKNPSIYQSYARIIEQFVRKQLKEHHISRNLSILYDDLLKNSNLEDDLYHDLTEVLFQNEIHCGNRNIKGVYVIHKELTEESFYPFVDGKAMISLYTEDSYVLLADMNDNRYTATIDYTIYPYMYGKQYVERCYEKNNINPKLILAMLDNTSAYQNSKNQLIELKNKALYITTLKQRYQEEYLKTILYEYSDFIDEERIFDYLERIDLSYFNSEERNIVIEFLIGRKQYEKAYDIMKEYGYENLNIKVLVSLCVYFLKKNEVKNDWLILLSYEILLSNHQKEEIMRYLVQYYNGTTENLLKVYKKAKEYHIDCIELEERLLAQMLFANRYMDDSYEIFYHIYNSEKNEKLKKAYLVSMAYQWILYDYQLQDELLKIMTQVIQREENEILLIAVLKSLSTQNQLSNDEILFIEVNLEKLMKKGIILSFYRDFIGKVKLDDKLTHTYFIEYKANPNKKVFLHYSLSSSLQEEEKNQVITMHNVFGGIYSAQFVLFYGESIEYYIIEDEKEKNCTQTIQITLDNKLEYEDDVESKYNQINLMLMAKELNDEETLIEMMKKVKLKEGMASYLFKPLL